MLSIILPSYKDPLLYNTIDSLVQNAEGEIEVIAVLDGYWTDKIYPKVKYLHLGKNRGMRDAINAGVSISKGEFIMRTDEHCIFAKGFDRIMTDSCEPNWIMTARRYFLDPIKWEVMDIPPVDYEKLALTNEKFEGQRWISRTKERKDIMIDETMAMQGSVWLMPRKWWDEVIGELQMEGYGPLYQDSHEMVFKTWKAGGKLMINKNTWFAHKHRSFARTHADGTPENPVDRKANWGYAIKIWKDYYNEIAPKWKI